ncbi:MAG: 2,3-butanediol dehydrogenase [Parabacteroides sp.]|uniref:Butanediol dehydrogenase n=1 Tax=Oceanihabitans sediminis TaxID=1812012 RepID=A0A368P6I6_9FLAO|nr:2,3-butanediol dehydrogenase [Oceanihabitans sediminis]MBP9580383.1 2,3-butanediol dehydrogenase [Parabacteroides sp.]RBP30945.1 (R,R)-butanediol dehydrogenase/meso-butanediol dehydrogenase/diacetyl reductase [Oceanihabitans sediminis]RCU56901.1 butanediol dehydrogenase [Oceanihabitans sediminis]
MSTQTMKAARWHAAKDIRVEETVIPTPNDDQVKIEVKFTGICGSDLHEYNHGPQLIPFDKPYLLNGHQGTTTLGHEFSGIVDQVGANVKGYKKGDRVVVEPIFRNPDSPFIESGEYNLSEPLGFVGLTSDGAFAKYVVVEDYMVHKIPDTMTFEQGAIVEPAAVAAYGIQQSGLKMGDTILISGAGPIGLLTVQVALAVGASQIFVSDLSEARLAKAKEIGATHTFDARDKDIPKKIKEMTGYGVDIFIDAAGVQASFDTGINSLRNGGTAVLVALFAKEVIHDALNQALREITVKGIIGYRNIFPQVIALINSGRLPVEKLVTSVIELDDIVEKGFEALIKSPTEVKILVEIK